MYAQSADDNLRIALYCHRVYCCLLYALLVFLAGKECERVACDASIDVYSNIFCIYQKQR